MKLEGRCYCGTVSYQAEGDPVMKAQCHCRECQYLTGGSANVFIAMPLDGFRYTKGQPKTFSRTDIPNAVTREFCADCGTQLVTRAPGFPAAIIKWGTIDDDSTIKGPDIAIYTLDKRAFHHIPDGMTAFERLPG